MTSPRGITNWTAVISALGTLIVIMAFVFGMGKGLDKIDVNAAHILNNASAMQEISVDLKGLPAALDALRLGLGIATTKITDNRQSVQQLFTNQTMMRQEIQRNSETKLSREDFFRTDKTITNRLLYLERKKDELCLRNYY